MYYRRFRLMLFAIAIIFGLPAISEAVSITLLPSNSIVQQGDTLSVSIKADDASGVCLGAFTLVYPSGAIELQAVPVSTTFFKTFYDARTGANPALANPWDRNTASAGKVLLSGAYINPDPNTGGGGAYAGQQTLFTVHFRVKNDALVGTYRFELQQTQLCNGPAGWGNDINNNGQYDPGDSYAGAPILVKAYAKGTPQWGTSRQLEVLLASFQSNPRALFSVQCVDTDGDGICNNDDGDDDNDGMPDEWETIHNLNPLKNDAASDPDGDNLTNLKEYQNQTDPNKADTDNDGMPDGWEVQYGLNPLIDDASGDSDKDGVSNLDEYKNGTNPSQKTNVPPGKPTLVSPYDGETDVDFSPELTTGVFFDQDSGDTHAYTRWQISTDPNFTKLVFDETNDHDLTLKKIPDFILQKGTTYYWRVLFYDNNGNASDWSESNFFTVLQYREDDQNSNGIPDEQEVDVNSDIDNDGIPDVNQTGFASVNAQNTNVQIGLKKSADIISIDCLKSISADDVDTTVNRPNDLPIGLICFRLTVKNPGGTINITVYFSKPADVNAKWYKYDDVNGWKDFSGNDQFSADRKSIKINLTDGGLGDVDGVGNGIIIDPSGLGVSSSGGGNSGGSGSGSSGSAGGGGGCFIATAAYGSAANVHVTILRNFRDTLLANNLLGWKFIALYNKYSPSMAKAIQQNDFLRALVRIGLLPLVLFSYASLKIGIVITAILTIILFSLFVGGALLGIYRLKRES